MNGVFYESADEVKYSADLSSRVPPVVQNRDWNTTTSLHEDGLCATLDFGVTVYKIGEIYLNKKKLPVQLDIFNYDRLLFMPVEPFVEIPTPDHDGNPEKLKMSVDEVMYRAGFVNGDICSYKEPVVLHLDNDYTNFEASNLVWTELSDSRYKAYYDQRKQDEVRLAEKLNGIEGCWQGKDFNEVYHWV